MYCMGRFKKLTNYSPFIKDIQFFQQNIILFESNFLSVLGNFVKHAPEKL